MGENKDNVFIKIQNVSKQFQIKKETVDVLEDINLQFQEGEFISIVGASGCGKSTLLRIIAGLETPSEGGVYLEDQEVVKPSINIGMVFQKSLLFPWLSVKKNVEFGISKQTETTDRKELVQSHMIWWD